MGHESLSVLSPAHRRNQNPVSPSASMFRRSSTFSRDEADLSWIALMKRHRFLLFTLALLVFLCTIYLYFAITLGENDCSSLSGKEEALCQLKRSKIKTSHGHKASRRLLSDPKFTLALFRGNEPDTEVNLATDATSWIEHIPSNDESLRILNLGCKNGKVIEHIEKQFIVTMLLFDCEEESLLDRGPSGLLHGFMHKQPPISAYLFDLIICNSCDKLALANDSKRFREFEPLLHDGGYFLWVSDSSGRSADGSSQSADIQISGWICLSRDGRISLWQKLRKNTS